MMHTLKVDELQGIMQLYPDKAVITKRDHEGSYFGKPALHQVPEESMRLRMGSKAGRLEPRRHRNRARDDEKLGLELINGED